MSELNHILLIGPGIIIGLIAAAPIGPVNLICIRRTLRYGMLNGFLSGMGAALGDGLFAIITGFGLTAAAQMIEGFSTALQLAGGTLLIIFGLYTYFAKVDTKLDSNAEAREKGTFTLARTIVSTFALTMSNPATLFGFTAMFTGLNGLAGSDASFFGAAFVVIGVVLGSALWWLVLTALVGLVHAKIDDRAIRIINHGSGLLVAVFGVAVLYHVATKLL